MNSLPVQANCWNRLGVWGDGSCPELDKVVHCHNCPVFANAGRRFLDAPSPAGYLAEWTKRLAAPLEEEEAGRTGVLVFRIGQEWLALPVGVLWEVASMRPVHRVPHRGGSLAGLVNIRGELLLCARLGKVLGLAHDESSATRLLVCRRDSERWVFPVDAADQVHRLADSEMGTLPATIGRAMSHLTRAVFSQQGRAVGLLDEERLFARLRENLR